MDKILDFLGLGDMSVITPGKVLFLAGAALLVVTIIVAIVFRLRRLRYDPSQAVYAMGDATAPMNNQYPTRRGTPGSTTSQGTASLQGEAVPNQTSGQMGPGQTAARTAGRTGTVPLQGSPFPDDAPAGDLQAYPAAGGLALGFQGRLADKVRLVHLDEGIQPGFQGGDLLGELMAVQGHGSLQPQGIPGPQPAGDEAVLRPLLQQKIPHGPGVLGFQVDLKPVLAGIAGAGEDAVHPLYPAIKPSGVVFFRDLFGPGDLFQHLLGVGPLQGDLGDLIRDILQPGTFGQMSAHPLKILLAVGGVHHNEIFLFALFVNQKVIHHAAGLVAHGAVAGPAQAHAVVGIGEQPVQTFQGRSAGEQELAHMGNIKDAAGGSHRLVLGNDPLPVLHRQDIAPKGNHLAARRQVRLIQRCFFLHNTLLLFSPCFRQRKKRARNTPCALCICT